MNIDITLSNAQIITEGSDPDTTDKSNNYGIYLDGYGKSGTIKIHLKNNYSITTKSDTNQSSTGYGIIFENFKGKIEIIIESRLSIDSSNGYAICINCPEATATITNNGSTKGIILRIRTYNCKNSVLSSSCNSTCLILSQMKTKGIEIRRMIKNATVMILALFVVILISSCSPETTQLCRVHITTEEDSRRLSASIKITDPLDSYDKYYRTIYKGKGNSYGNMGINEYKLLDNTGILLSQGLWDIEVFFVKKNKAINSLSEDFDFSAKAENVFVNLNTTSITVSVNSCNGDNKGTIDINGYSIAAIPFTSRVTPINVDIYKFDNSQITKLTESPISLDLIPGPEANYGKTLSNIEPGFYYAVFDIKAMSMRQEITVITDVIGFVVRGGMTTTIEGEYVQPSSSENKVIVDPNGKVDINTDIKNFDTENFGNDVTYVIDGGSSSNVYQMIPDNTTAPFNKELTNQNVTIDMNGNSIVNSTNRNDKTYFTIDKNASLSLINTQVGQNTIGAANFGSNQASKNTNFIVNGGKLNIGSVDGSVSSGSIIVNGVTASQEAGGNPARAAIEFSTFGGDISLLAPSGKYTKIDNTVRGISNILPRSLETNRNTNSNMNLNITLENATIKATGDSNAQEVGISIDGTKTLNSSTDFYAGAINITIKGKGEDYSILTTNSKNNKCAMEQSGIYITNYNGKINITLDSNARITSQNGCGIYLKNCSGQITITNNGSITGYYGAITYDNCDDVTIKNHGTLSSTLSSYSMVNYSNSNAPKTSESTSNTTVKKTK